MNTTQKLPNEIELSCGVAEELVKRANGSKERVVDLEQRFRDAVKFLDEQTDSVKTTWLVWLEESSKFLTETRTWRMAIEKEMRDGTASCKAMSDFLASPETRQSLAVLREFVDLAERLKALKESGHLDSLRINLTNE